MRRALMVAISVIGLNVGSAHAQTCAPAPNGLVSWWPGEGSTADVVSAHDGTIAGNVAFASGVVGQAFLFDGHSYIAVSRRAALMPSTGITVDAWVNPSADGDYRAFPAIVKNIGAPDGSAYGGYALELSGTAAFFWVTVAGFGWQPAGGVELPLGAWTHLAGVYDGLYVRLYVNGVESGFASYATGVIEPGVLGLNIGHDPYGDADGPRFFQGAIDEVDLFNRALSPAEIQAIYHAGSVGKCTPFTNVSIQIKPPAAPPVAINQGASGVIAAAILSTPTFDATQVDPGSVTLAGARVSLIGRSGKYSCSVQDVNGDGLRDLLCQISTAQFLIQSGDSTAVLEGQTFGGVLIRGQEAIRIVPEYPDGS